MPDNLDGRSIVPLLRCETVDDWPNDVFAEFHGYEPTLASVRMVRTDSWKYVYNPYSEDELYDMKSDPHELPQRSKPARLQTCPPPYESAYGQSLAGNEGQHRHGRRMAEQFV